ncbi:PIR protein [Plasmodium vivax]|uniref:VIR protein n=1 Tax=Plasmodium vivax TaxID=5855 RepID=A0A565A5L5_PLAVI|nr:PIR protein [Plasmodium vivax]
MKMIKKIYPKLLSELLKELPLYIFYEKIHRELSNNGANDNFAECNTKLLSTDPKESKLLKLCKSFHNVFSKASELNLYFKESSFNTRCFQMNLLLYSNVISITKETNIIDKFYKALHTISKVAISNKQFCDIKNYEYHPEEFKKMKYLYEFLFTYYDIYQKISQPGNTKKQLYCNHIKENFRLYNSIKKNCPELNKCSYKNELMQIKNIFSDHAKLSEIYSKCNYEPTQCKENSIETNDIPCLKEIVSHSATPEIDSDQNNVGNEISKVLTYSIPSLATLTMLYKFTPLGSWLYSKIKRTNNMENNIKAENYYISHHNTRIEEIDPGNNSNNTY